MIKKLQPKFSHQLNYFSRNNIYKSCVETPISPKGSTNINHTTQAKAKKNNTGIEKEQIIDVSKCANQEQIQQAQNTPKRTEGEMTNLKLVSQICAQTVQTPSEQKVVSSMENANSNQQSQKCESNTELKEPPIITPTAIAQESLSGEEESIQHMKTASKKLKQAIGYEYLEPFSKSVFDKKVCMPSFETPPEETVFSNYPHLPNQFEVLKRNKNSSQGIQKITSKFAQFLNEKSVKRCKSSVSFKPASTMILKSKSIPVLNKMSQYEIQSILQQTAHFSPLKSKLCTSDTPLTQSSIKPIGFQKHSKNLPGEPNTYSIENRIPYLKRTVVPEHKSIDNLLKRFRSFDKTTAANVPKQFNDKISEKVGFQESQMETERFLK